MTNPESKPPAPPREGVLAAIRADFAADRPLGPVQTAALVAEVDRLGGELRRERARSASLAEVRDECQRCRAEERDELQSLVRMLTAERNDAQARARYHQDKRSAEAREVADLRQQVQRVRDLLAAKTVGEGTATEVRYLLDQADVLVALDGPAQ